MPDTISTTITDECSLNDGEGVEITETGRIEGSSDGIRVESGTSVSNAGTISGEDYGIYHEDESDISGGIDNSGTISGVVDGIFLDSNSDISGGIVNQAGGTISGSNRALNFHGGNNLVINYGLLDGSVILGDWSLNIKGTDSRITGTTEGGVLNQKHSITTASGFNNNGTLAIADGDSTTIDGNYTQQADGVIRTGATSKLSYGRLNVTGTADISASGKFDVQVSVNDQLSNGDKLDNVLSAGTLVADDNLSVTDNSALWTFSAVNDGSNGIDLIAQYNALCTFFNLCTKGQ